MVKCPKQYAVKRLSNLEVFFMKIFKVILESGIAEFAKSNRCVYQI